MILKNKRLLLFVGLLFVAGLLITYFWQESYDVKDVNENIQVRDIQLLMDVQQVEQLIGYKGVISECIHGYNYTYEELKLEIGFRATDDRVRRLTWNYEQDYSAYQMNTGIAVEEARMALLDQYLLKQAEYSAYTFFKGDVAVTLLSDDGVNVRGFNLELRDTNK